MEDKLMYIPIDDTQNYPISAVDENYWLKSLNIASLNQNNQDLSNQGCSMRERINIYKTLAVEKITSLLLHK